MNQWKNSVYVCSRARKVRKVANILFLSVPLSPSLSVSHEVLSLQFQNASPYWNAKFSIVKFSVWISINDREFITRAHNVGGSNEKDGSFFIASLFFRLAFCFHFRKTYRQFKRSSPYLFNLNQCEAFARFNDTIKCLALLVALANFFFCFVFFRHHFQIV